jgi:hypothetical protein
VVPKLDRRRQVSTPPQVRPWLAGHAVRRAHLSPVDMAGGRRPCQIVHDLEVRQELGRRAKVPCAARCRVRRHGTPALHDRAQPGSLARAEPARRRQGACTAVSEPFGRRPSAIYATGCDGSHPGPSDQTDYGVLKPNARHDRTGDRLRRYSTTAPAPGELVQRLRPARVSALRPPLVGRSRSVQQDACMVSFPRYFDQRHTVGAAASILNLGSARWELPYVALPGVRVAVCLAPSPCSSGCHPFHELC